MNQKKQLSEAEISARELEIVRYVAWGYAAKQIAHKLHLSLHTVRQHLKNIHGELQAHSTSDLTRWYIFREYGISDTWRKVIALGLLIVSLLSVVESSCNVRVFTRGIMTRVSRARGTRRDDYLILSI